MKRFIALFILLIFMTLSINAQNKQLILNFGTGLSTPIAETGFTNLYSMGFNLNGGAGMIFNPNIAGRLELEMNRFPQSSNDFGQSGNFTVTSLRADLLAGQVTNSRTVNPYGVAGIGAYMLTVSVTQDNITTSATETDLGLALGGGIDFKLSPTVGIYTEAQYNIIFNNGGAAKGYLPIKVGINYIP